ncbi:unnamed protein product, partial [Adineta steineri]
ARDDVHEEKIKNDQGAGEELMEINRNNASI